MNLCDRLFKRNKYAATPTGQIGIDVSHWQGTFNFKTAKDKGIKFVIHKVCDVGYLGPFYDVKVKENYTKAKAENLIFGGYGWLNPFYDPKKQAEFYINWYKEHPLDLIAMDFEDNHFVNPNDYIYKAQVWLGEIEDQLNITPAIYTAEWFMSKFDRKKTQWMGSYPLWVASYRSSPPPIVPKEWKNYAIWQYTDKGTYPYHQNINPGRGKEYGSSSHGLDMNWFNGSYDDLLTFTGKSNEPVEPPVTPPVIPPVVSNKIIHKTYSQSDPRWKNKQLGTSNTTIGGYGCLITAVSMLLTNLGKNINPEQLNRELVRVGGYVGGNRFVYDSLKKIYPDIAVDWDNFINCETTPAPLDKIRTLLRNTRPVIVKVDYKPETFPVDEHWVLIDGIEGEDFWITDPIDGERILFSARYGNPSRYILAIRMYYSTLTPPPKPIGDVEIPVEPPAGQDYLFKGRCITHALTKFSQPGIGGMKVGYLRDGDVVNVYEIKNSYWRIEKSVQVWVNSRYMEQISQPVNPTPPGNKDYLWDAECTAWALTKFNTPAPGGTVLGYLRKGDLEKVYEEKNNYWRIDKNTQIWVNSYYMIKK